MPPLPAFGCVRARDPVGEFEYRLQRVQAGAEVLIERDAQPFAVIRAAAPSRRTISECIALMSGESTATIDPDFAKDVEAAIAATANGIIKACGRVVRLVWRCQSKVQSAKTLRISPKDPLPSRSRIDDQI